MLAAYFGSESGSDDKQQHTADSENADDDREGIVVFTLLGEFVFDLDQPFLIGVFLLVEPASLGTGNGSREQEHDNEFDEDVFHLDRGGK